MARCLRLCCLIPLLIICGSCSNTPIGLSEPDAATTGDVRGGEDVRGGDFGEDVGRIWSCDDALDNVRADLERAIRQRSSECTRDEDCILADVFSLATARCEPYDSGDGYMTICSIGVATEAGVSRVMDDRDFFRVQDSCRFLQESCPNQWVPPCPARLTARCLEGRCVAVDEETG